MAAEWIVERTLNRRFPYRVRIEQEGRTLLAVRAQNSWPGAGSQVFCLRETEFDPGETLEPVERVPVAHLARIGRKLSVTLDRPTRKRCEFLKIERVRSDGSGTYEQIFFRTEAAVRAHRTSPLVEVRPQTEIDVAIDERERYPWRFPGARATRRRLPVGDYALILEERIAAVVERKALANFLSDVHAIKALHQQLAELGSYPHAALVVEARYADLGDPKRIGRWPASHLLNVVGELAALHPKVPVVFAGNRKLANVWTQRFFAAVAGAVAAAIPDAAGEPLARYFGDPADGGLDTRIRIAAGRDLPDGFSIDDLRAAFPGVADARLRQGLDRLRREGRIRCSGRGRGARWTRTAPGSGPAPIPAATATPGQAPGGPVSADG